MADNCAAELCPYWPGEGCVRAFAPCGDDDEEVMRAYVSWRWADDWDSPEDAAYDEAGDGT